MIRTKLNDMGSGVVMQDGHKHKECAESCLGERHLSAACGVILSFSHVACSNECSSVCQCGIQNGKFV